MAKHMKVSTKIWEPLIGSLTKKMEDACLRRDAFLNRVLEKEVPALEQEVAVPNSEQARDFIANRLDTLRRKPVTLSLRQDVVKHLDNVCNDRRMVRDSFFNRLFLLLALPPKAIDTLFFHGDNEWRIEVWSEYRNEGPAFNNAFYPLQPEIDPFWAIRTGLEHFDRERDDEPMGIYTRVLDDTLFADTDLFGLNCYLPDRYVPGHTEQVDKYRPKTLSELLAIYNSKG